MANFRQPRREVPIRWKATLDELLPQDQLARFVWAKLMSIDFCEIEALYPSIAGKAGAPPFHPRLMTALWVYGMTQALSTAAAIARACSSVTGCRRIDFLWLAGEQAPCAQTLLNFIQRVCSDQKLLGIWAQLLVALHRAGHIDLSAIFEDGTKLRANASLRSFHVAEEIDVAVREATAQLAKMTEHLAKSPESQWDPKENPQTRALRDKLERAQRAQRELQERVARSKDSLLSGDEPRRFEVADFRHDPQKNVLFCPAGEVLVHGGTHRTTNKKGFYDLFGKADCSDCPMKARCTEACGRRVKVQRSKACSPVSAPAVSPVASSPDSPCTQRVEPAIPRQVQPATESSGLAQGPKASLTDPEAVLMLATSVKRFEPSFNADLVVTRQQFIVHQFLHKHPTDYHSLEIALPKVCSTLGRPDCCIGDSHYGTQANLLLADDLKVPLYAPPAGGEQPPRNGGSQPAADPLTPGRFTRDAFRHQAEPDAMLCPTDQQLRFVNTYSASNGRGAYTLYQRSDCSDCPQKAQCTTDRGRRLKVPIALPSTDATSAVNDHHAAAQRLSRLIEAQRARQAEFGERTRKLRGQTSEPVNAQLKQHGLARFHVRGLAKCSVILTLACIAHNLMKWTARQARQAREEHAHELSAAVA